MKRSSERLAGLEEGGSDEFAYDATIRIKGADLKEISSRLDAQLDALPSRLSVTNEGGGRSGNGEIYYHLHTRYRMDGAIYFTDFLLDEYKADEVVEGVLRHFTSARR